MTLLRASRRLADVPTEIPQADGVRVWSSVDAVTSGDAPLARGTATALVTTHNDGANLSLLLPRLLDEPAVGEVVVVASGCTDDTVPRVLDVAARDPRVRLFIEEERSGKVAAINFGFACARGDAVVLVSGDVLPEPGAITLLVEALDEPEVAIVGGRPVPVDAPDTFLGATVHLLWGVHDRLSRRLPKVGEVAAIRGEALQRLPGTAVDEACLQALLEAAGWRSAYVPEAVIHNRGPGTVRDFVEQRRRIHGGHLHLRARNGYTVPSLHLRILLVEVARHLHQGPYRLTVRRLWWALGSALLEALARGRARRDVASQKESHVWRIIPTAKLTPPGENGGDAAVGARLATLGVAAAAAGQHHDQRYVPM